MKPIEKLRHLERLAEEGGGAERLQRQHAAGKLTARERMEELFDPGTFRETGLFGTSQIPADYDKTPADGKVTGTGRVDGRRAAVVAYDFTVKGASSSPTSGKKMQHMKDLGQRVGMPVVYLNESTGVRMPDIMGGSGMGGMNDRTRFLRRRVPAVGEDDHAGQPIVAIAPGEIGDRAAQIAAPRRRR